MSRSASRCQNFAFGSNFHEVKFSFQEANMRVVILVIWHIYPREILGFNSEVESLLDVKLNRLRHFTSIPILVKVGPQNFPLPKFFPNIFFTLPKFFFSQFFSQEDIRWGWHTPKTFPLNISMSNSLIYLLIFQCKTLLFSS